MKGMFCIEDIIERLDSVYRDSCYDLQERLGNTMLGLCYGLVDGEDREQIDKCCECSSYFRREV